MFFIKGVFKSSTYLEGVTEYSRDKLITLWFFMDIYKLKYIYKYFIWFVSCIKFYYIFIMIIYENIDKYIKSQTYASKTV